MARNAEVFDTRALRLKLGLSQPAFWGKVGVTQPGGSRFEKEGRVSLPVRMLIEVVHIKGVDLDTINVDEILVGRHVRKYSPDDFNRYLETAKRKEANRKCQNSR